MNHAEAEQLERAIESSTGMALEAGLDFFTMRYEVCPAETLYSIGAYGMPTRFTHWSFGKTYHRMKSEYDYGLSRIYELVINSDPCYTFLLDHNTLLQNKLIVAHVLAHSDFFKNNAMFRGTDRRMVERMAVFARRMRAFEQEFGSDAVEETLDAALAIHEHVDPHTRFGAKGGFKEAEGGTKDVVGFIAGESRSLADWQREVLYMLREEMLYFWPQMETKILNEGWATFWHLRLVRQLELTGAEIMDFAKMNAGVVQPGTGSLNPYYLGVKMLEYIERHKGLDALFEIRETESDVSFLRNYLDKALVEEMDLFLFGRKDDLYVVTSKEVEEVKQTLIRQRTNGGFPYVTAMDGDHGGRGELLLLHRYDGLELDRRYVDRTLPLVHRLWGKPVHLETRDRDNRRLVYSFDGEKVLAGVAG
jgi:spore cortex formation protein SpoVR/YcgB (stage V sporulation)